MAFWHLLLERSTIYANDLGYLKESLSCLLIETVSANHKYSELEWIDVTKLFVWYHAVVNYRRSLCRSNKCVVVFDKVLPSVQNATIGIDQKFAKVLTIFIRGKIGHMSLRDIVYSSYKVLEIGTP